MAVDVAEKRATFRSLHEQGCFVLPNPWDRGSARILQTLGFKALATTSSGFAWTTGRPDYGVERDDVLQHLTGLCAAVDLPVNADFENGFAREPEGVAENVKLAVATGVSGLSIEDLTGEPHERFFEHGLAVERIKAARAAIDETGTGVVLVARTERPAADDAELKVVIDRLSAFAEAGADCLYAPFIRDRQQIATLVKALAPHPLNVLMGAPLMSVAELADLGVRRISVGGALARVAWGAVIRAAEQMINEGSFEGLRGAADGRRLNALFSDF